MELALQKFITSAAKLIDVTNLDDHNPFILKLTDGTLGNIAKYAMIASTIEPITKILPINGIWLCFDPNSNYYNQALKLVGYEMSIHSTRIVDAPIVLVDEPFVNRWVLVQKLSDLFTDINIYSTEGLQGPDGVQGLIGLPGPKGLDVVLDPIPVISEAVKQYVALRGY
jgi:hypothetical protein